MNSIKKFCLRRCNIYYLTKKKNYLTEKKIPTMYFGIDNFFFLNIYKLSSIFHEQGRN